MLFFSISSISAQSVNNLDELGNDKILKSDSSSSKTTALKSTTKAKANATNSAKKTNATKTSTKKTNTTKTKEKTTTVKKKTLAKTSTSFMNYVEKNGKFPKVKISNKNYSNTEYLYLMTKAVENDSNPKVEIKKNLVKKYNNTNPKSVKGTLNKTEYVKIAGKTRKFIDKNKRAPNWVSSSKGNIPYNQLILSYSKCLDYYNKNNRLPNTIKLDDLDLDKINSKINKNKAKSATSVKTTNKSSNKTTNTAQKSTNVTKKTNATKTNTGVKANTTNPSSKNDDGENVSLVEKALNNVHSILNNILDRLDPSKYQVDVTKTDEANVKLNTSKVNVDINGKSTVNVKVSAKNTTKKTTTATTTTKKANATKTSKTTKTTAKKTTTTKSKSVAKSAAKTVSANKTSINEALKKYLTSTKNCQVKNKAIQDLAKTLTSNLKSDYDKGKKLFNWVRDNIQYKKYRNTRRGAVKTLQNKKGNCVDQSHLLIALSRASGIPARYVKGGNCKFSTGYVSGHIWTQMYINNKWVVADTTSSRNTLGKIRNWNTKNYKLYGQFISISF